MLGANGSSFYPSNPPSLFSFFPIFFFSFPSLLPPPFSHLYCHPSAHATHPHRTPSPPPNKQQTHPLIKMAGDRADDVAVDQVVATKGLLIILSFKKLYLLLLMWLLSRARKRNCMVHRSICSRYRSPRDGGRHDL